MVITEVHYILKMFPEMTPGSNYGQMNWSALICSFWAFIARQSLLRQWDGKQYKDRVGFVQSIQIGLRNGAVIPIIKFLILFP